MPSRKCVDADDDVLAAVQLPLELVRGLGDLALEPAFLDPAHRAVEHRAGAELVDVREQLLGPAFHLVGERFDEVRTAERIGDVRDTCLVGDDLLRPQRDARGPVGREGQRLVHRVGVEALRTAEHTGERFDRGAHDVHLGLLRRQADTPAVCVWNRSCSERSARAP